MNAPSRPVPSAPRPIPTSAASGTRFPRGPLTSAELAAAVPDRRARDGYIRMWHGMYRRADQPDDLRLRAVALARSWPEGVLRGRSAALLWGDDSAPGDTPPEIWLPATRRAVPGRVYRYGALPPSAVTEVDGLRVTTPLRTCRDLVADLPHEDAVVALDRMCAAGPGFEGLLRAATAHPSGSGSGALAEVMRDLDPRAGSPDEARARLVLHVAGHRGFVHGHEVEVRRRRTVPSLADPDPRVAVEVRSGRESVDERARDGRTWAALRRAGWTILVVRTDPDAEPTPEPAPGPDVGSVSAALRARWPATDVLEPLIADATVDPLGWWARPA